MSINFPTGATPNQIYSYNGLNWIYTGTYWKVYPQFTDILPLTGGTFDKNAETLTLSNVINDSISVSGFSDYFVTGGTYDSNTGIVTFLNTSGGSFNISGFTSGGTSLIMAYKKYDVTPDINTVSRVSFLPVQAPQTSGGIATTKFYAIIIQKEVTIEAVWHRVNVGGAGRTLTIALYTNYQTYIPRPDNLVFQIPTDFDMSVTGPQEVTLTSPITLQPGVYWVGFSTNGGTLNTFINPVYNHWGILGYQDLNGNSGAILANQTVLFDSLNPYPSVWNLFLSQTPTDGSNVPVIYFKLI